MKTINRALKAEEIRDLVGESPTMLEVGSHDGSDTIKFLQAMPGIMLYCFEPDPRPIARFRKRIGDDSRVRLYGCAVGDVDGEALFHASTGKAGSRDDWDCSGSLCEPTGHLVRSPAIKFKQPAMVRCIRLDTWRNQQLLWQTAYDLEQIDFAWIDIQGSQRMFLAGAQKTLAITRYLYIEAHRKPLYDGETTQEELIALLPNFEALGLYGDENILFKNRSL